MPHVPIIIYDENGNAIGEIRLPHEEGGGGLAEQDPPSATINLARVAELLKGKKEKEVS